MLKTKCPILEDTRTVTFVDRDLLKLEHGGVDKDFVKQHTRFPRYQGWFNSATWSFNLYFFQESENHRKLEALRHPTTRKISYHRAQRLFSRSQYDGSMYRVDDWCEGSVDYKEIVDNYAKQVD